MLNRIRLNKTLFHIPKSHGSYVDARTSRRTNRGANANERPVSLSYQECANEIAQKLERTPQDTLYVVLSLIQKTKPPKLQRQSSTVQYAWSVCVQSGYAIGNLLALNVFIRYLTYWTCKSTEICLQVRLHHRKKDRLLIMMRTIEY